MEAFIRGIGIISPQKTFDTKDFLTEVIAYNQIQIHAIEPPYKEFLNPVLARRMGRIIKMSIAASSICLKDAGIEIPDAIMTGTGLGCLEDTEKFLESIIINEELFLTPTSFMQSTHNTVSAQIALQLKCRNYNFTYVHKGFSFESALLDGLLTIAEGNGNNVLVGGHDEMTNSHFRIRDRVGYWKKENIPAMDLIHSKTNGSISGEGAAFFILSNVVSDQNYARLRGIKSIYKPESSKEIADMTSELLRENKLTPEDIDIVIYGINGDMRFDHVYHELKNNYFQKSDSTWFKHLCGEYQTSGSFALWMASMILKTQTVPDVIRIGYIKRTPIKNVLIINGFMNTNYTAFLLSQCDS